MMPGGERAERAAKRAAMKSDLWLQSTSDISRSNVDPAAPSRVPQPSREQTPTFDLTSDPTNPAATNIPQPATERSAHEMDILFGTPVGRDPNFDLNPPRSEVVRRLYRSASAASASAQASASQPPNVTVSSDLQLDLILKLSSTQNELLKMVQNQSDKYSQLLLEQEAKSELRFEELTSKLNDIRLAKSKAGSFRSSDSSLNSLHIASPESSAKSVSVHSTKQLGAIPKSTKLQPSFDKVEQCAEFVPKPPVPKIESIKLSNFSGVMDKVGAVQFIRDLDLVKEANSIPDQTFICSWVPAVLRREAQAWFIEFKHLFVDWKTFKSEFLKRFRSFNHEFDVIGAVTALQQQSNESFEKYFARCYDLLLKADDTISVQHKISAIICGLNNNLYHKVMNLRFETLEEFCNRAQSIESSLKLRDLYCPSIKKDKSKFVSNDKKSFSSKKSNYNPDAYCSIHKAHGHWNSQCFKRQNGSKENTKANSFRQSNPQNSNTNKGVPHNQHYGNKAPKPFSPKNSNFQAGIQGNLDAHAEPFYLNTVGSSP